MYCICMNHTLLSKKKKPNIPLDLERYSDSKPFVLKICTAPNFLATVGDCKSMKELRVSARGCPELFDASAQLKAAEPLALPHYIPRRRLNRRAAAGETRWACTSFLGRYPSSGMTFRQL